MQKIIKLFKLDRPIIMIIAKLKVIVTVSPSSSGLESGTPCTATLLTEVAIDFGKP
jgi:hypothetical protein